MSVCIAAAVLLVGNLVVGIAATGSSSDGASDASAGAGCSRLSARVADDEVSASTPSSQWRKGEVPLLLQTDEAWADEPYAGGTVGENGCGPTCMTMAYVCLTGRKNYDPALMCEFAESGGFTEQGMTTWSFMTEGARELGLSSREISADEGAVRTALENGEVVICSVRPGDFTTTGHFILIGGIDGKGRLTVFDPNSAQRSARLWDAGDVLAQCRNLWAIS